MAKVKISEYSATPSSNTDIDNIDINEGCSPSGINNAIRALMSHLKNWQSGTSGDTLPIASGGTSSTTASSARTALSAAASGTNSDITSLTGLTTALSVAQGGTGVTTSTGSGAVVRATSPTIATPSLTSPAMTGTPTAPTASAGTNTTQVATTAFVLANSGSKLVVNVKDFGATGDGTTNDTSAINTCITNNSGKTIYFPAGTYVISGSGILAASNSISIVGAGMFNTIIKPAASTTAAITMGSGGAMTDQTLSNLTIDCTNASSTCTALRANNCSNFLADNFNIIKANLGIRIQYGVLQTYSNFRITDSTTAAIKFEEGGNDYSFTNGEVVNNTTQPTTAGLWVTQSTSSIRLTDVHFLKQRTAILIAPSSGYDSTWHFFNNVICDTGSESGINIAPTGTGTVRGVSLIGCWTSSNTLDGIRIGSTGTVNGVNVVGHRSYINGAHGYNVNSTTCSNIKFTGCEAYSNSVTTSNTKSGFFVTGGCSRITIQDCSSGSGVGFSASQFYGIELSLGATTNYIVTGNMLLGNVTGGFSDATTPTVTSKVVNDNLS